MTTKITDSVGATRTRETPPLSTKSIARLTGLLYLLIFVTAGFSEGFVRASLFVPGDATGTAANVVAAEGLFRLGIVTDLVAFSLDAVVAILLYVLLRPANRTVATLAASLRLIAHPAIASVNMLNQYMVLQVLSGEAYLSAFTPAQVDALVLLLLTAHRYGYLIAGVFFGLHLLALGYLLYKSSLFPALLGGLAGLAGVGYLTESFTFFLVPAYEPLASAIVVVTAVVGEIALALYLVVRGVRAERPAVSETG